MSTVREVFHIIAAFLLIVCVILVIIFALTALMLERYTRHSRMISNGFSRTLRRIY